MWNIQGLMLMMAVMVYAAPTTPPTTSPTTPPTTPPKPTVKDIQDAVKDLNNTITPETRELRVPLFTENSSTTCPDKFFCLAEKALETLKNTTEIKNLERTLLQYNKGNDTCVLDNTQGTESLGMLLKKLSDCCDQILA